MAESHKSPISYFKIDCWRNGFIDTGIFLFTEKEGRNPFKAIKRDSPNNRGVFVLGSIILKSIRKLFPKE
jgi:hypothetical protein